MFNIIDYLCTILIILFILLCLLIMGAVCYGIIKLLISDWNERKENKKHE